MESLPDFCKELLVQSMKGMKMKSLEEKEPVDLIYVWGHIPDDQEDEIRNAYDKKLGYDIPTRHSTWMEFTQPRLGGGYTCAGGFRMGYIASKGW